MYLKIQLVPHYKLSSSPL